MSKTENLDVKGMLCPLPVLKAAKKLRSLQAGDELLIEATDPASAIDFPHFCNESGHILVEQNQNDDVFTFTIRKQG